MDKQSKLHFTHMVLTSSGKCGKKSTASFLLVRLGYCLHPHWHLRCCRLEAPLTRRSKSDKHWPQVLSRAKYLPYTDGNDHKPLRLWHFRRCCLQHGRRCPWQNLRSWKLSLCLLYKKGSFNITLVPLNDVQRQLFRSIFFAVHVQLMIFETSTDLHHPLVRQPSFPNGRATATFIHPTFHLKGCSRNSPNKVLRKRPPVLHIQRN